MKLLVPKNNAHMIKKKGKKKDSRFWFFTKPPKFFLTLYLQYKDWLSTTPPKIRHDGLI